MGRLRFEEAAADVVNGYKTNGKGSIDEVERRIAKHLAPFFGGRRMAAITTADVRTYVVQRQAETEQVRKAHDIVRKDGTVKRVPEQRRTIAGVSNAEINRELTILSGSLASPCTPGSCCTRPTFRCCARTTRARGFSSLSSSRVSRRTDHRRFALSWSSPTYRLAHRVGGVAPGVATR